MLKKFYKQILTLVLSAISYIAGLFGDEIKDALQNRAINFIVTYKVLYIIAGLLVILSIFLYMIDKSNNQNNTNKIKLSRKQKKFIKKGPIEINIEGALYKFDIDFLLGSSRPSACQLRLYNENTGLTETVAINGLFRGKDPHYLHHTAQSYLNTIWDEYNK